MKKLFDEADQGKGSAGREPEKVHEGSENCG